ncbi:hypothetical protein BDB01DRAFT_824969 [Pilobolus umbonatus]|nr:hypothetical protein BDB01DRAFT_824969 [Pilobolus umbonatus]
MEKPWIDISLPSGYAVPPIELSLMYVLVLYLEFLFLRTTRWRYGIIIIHLVLPLMFECSVSWLTMFFMGLPWCFASFLSVMSIAYVPTTDSDWQIRKRGVAKIGLGLLKLTDRMLSYPWLSGYSLMCTGLFGIKGYLFLGVVDVCMGIHQVLLAVNYIDVFDSPIISYSKRWNRAVRNIFHNRVFHNKEALDESWITPRDLRGLTTFAISGFLHEWIIMAYAAKSL